MPSTSSSSIPRLAIDLRQRQFLARLIALSFVTLLIDRLGIDKRRIQAVELVLNRLNSGNDTNWLGQFAILIRRRCSAAFDGCADPLGIECGVSSDPDAGCTISRRS